MLCCVVSKNTTILVVHYSSLYLCNSCQICFFVLLITSGTGLRPVLSTDPDAADDQTHLKSDREHKFTLVNTVKAVKGCQNNQIPFPTLLQNQNKKYNMTIFFWKEK